MVSPPALWWTYFDVVAKVAEQTLRQATGTQVKLARDSYSYLHLPMIAGIVLVALGVKKALGHVEDPLKTVPAFALCAGPALYYLAHVAFRWRNRHTLAHRRIVVAALLLAFIPVATEIVGPGRGGGSGRSRGRPPALRSHPVPRREVPAVLVAQGRGVAAVPDDVAQSRTAGTEGIDPGPFPVEGCHPGHP